MLELDQNEKYRKGACGTVRTFGFLLLSLFSLYGGTTAQCAKQSVLSLTTYWLASACSRLWILVSNAVTSYFPRQLTQCV